MSWDEEFMVLFESCARRYRGGDTDFANYYTKGELAFLAGIGCKPREFFDFIEDYCDEGLPLPTTTLLMAAARRDYFLTIQKSEPSDVVLTRDDIPGFGEELAGMAYLPRILAKGRAKLRGELDPDLMFGCGGDRNFLKTHGNIHPADFLRTLWAAGDADAKMATWIGEHTRPRV